MGNSELSIINARVFDGTAEELVDGPIHVRGDRIIGIGGAGHPEAELIDAGGGTVIPGLIDAHFHAYGTSLDLLDLQSSPLSYIALAGAARLAATLARGFTTVRDVAGGDPGLARAISTGLIASPRYLYTGPALSQTGGHGDSRPGDRDLCASGNHLAEVVDGVENLRVAVRRRFQRGAHAIKIMTSGGVVSPTDPIRAPQYSAEEVRAVTDEAARRGSYVAAHCYSPEAIAHSVRCGVRSIEHGNLLDAETAELMRNAGAYLVPTLITYDAMSRRGAELGLSVVSQEKNAQVLAAGKEAVQLALAAGVSVGFGTDLMGELEDEQLQGLRLQCEVAGVLATLRSATSVNADLLGREDLGRIAAGAAADLVILPANPFEDPTVLWTESAARVVIQGGRVLCGVRPR